MLTLYRLSRRNNNSTGSWHYSWTFNFLIGALSEEERETLVSEIESLNNEEDLSELGIILVDLDPDEFLKC